MNIKQLKLLIREIVESSQKSTFNLNVATATAGEKKKFVADLQGAVVAGGGKLIAPLERRNWPSFEKNGEQYNVSYESNPEELMLQNKDGSPSVKSVQVDSDLNGNVFVCSSFDELSAGISKL